MSDKRLFRVYLSRHDRERLELIREIHGLSLSAVMRMALRAACRDLGMSTDDDEKKIA
jgi:hypothetical protein